MRADLLRAFKRRAIFAAAGLVCGSLFATGAAHAQSGLQADSLNTSKLNYEKPLTALYLGDFDHVGWHPERDTFATLFPMYVTSFGRQCAAYLPTDRVEIMTQECARESTPVNVYGNPVGPSSCVEYRTVGTGIYAKPDLYRIKTRLDALQGNAVLGDMLFDRQADPFSTTAKWTDALIMANDDAQEIFSSNACDSAALQRLEDNMARFARGEPPLKLASGATLADVRARAPAQAASQSADHQRLIDDLIADNARGWMLNQYISGSVSNVDIAQRDANNRPVSIRANYRFAQFGQVTSGWVQVRFDQGRPSCLYFYDAPSTCRVASPRIANAYERGEY